MRVGCVETRSSPKMDEGWVWFFLEQWFFSVVLNHLTDKLIDRFRFYNCSSSAEAHTPKKSQGAKPTMPIYYKYGIINPVSFLGLDVPVLVILSHLVLIKLQTQWQALTRRGLPGSDYQCPGRGGKDNSFQDSLSLIYV